MQLEAVIKSMVLRMTDPEVEYWFQHISDHGKLFNLSISQFPHL